MFPGETLLPWGRGCGVNTRPSTADEARGPASRSSGPAQPPCPPRAAGPLWSSLLRNVWWLLFQATSPGSGLASDASLSLPPRPAPGTFPRPLGTSSSQERDGRGGAGVDPHGTPSPDLGPPRLSQLGTPSPSGVTAVQVPGARPAESACGRLGPWPTRGLNNRHSRSENSRNNFGWNDLDRLRSAVLDMISSHFVL